MPVFSRRPLCAALLVALSASALAAESSDPIQTPDATQTPDRKSQTLDEGQVTGSSTNSDYNASTANVGKMQTPLRDFPQSIPVIDRAVLDAQGATSFADALRNVPGITLGGAEGGQIGNNINLRGFTARTDIYIDGFRDRGQYYRDTFDLDAIEVLKGP